MKGEDQNHTTSKRGTDQSVGRVLAMFRAVEHAIVNIFEVADEACVKHDHLPGLNILRINIDFHAVHLFEEHLFIEVLLNLRDNKTLQIGGLIIAGTCAKRRG
jgi:hypothetical protein